MKRTLGSLEAEVVRLIDQKGEAAGVGEAAEEMERGEEVEDTRFGESRRRSLKERRNPRSLRL